MSLITISKGIGCGKLAIGQGFADELNVEFYAREMEHGNPVSFIPESG